MNKKPNEYAELSSNEELSLVLTRYASIKGVAVQRHRFDYPESTSKRSKAGRSVGIDLAAEVSQWQSRSLDCR
jgi:hypothetical protein